MKKCFFISIFVFSVCYLSAQGNDSFEDYLSHYKEMEFPMPFSLDTVRVTFSREQIPLDYINKYICGPDKPCNIDPHKYRHRYGIQFILDDYIAVVVSVNCDDYNECFTKFGLGIEEYLMIVYSSTGEIIDQCILALGSDQHFYYGNFGKVDNSCNLLSVSMKQGTLYEYLDKKESIFEGVMDYYTIKVDQNGKIHREECKTTNVRVSCKVAGLEILKEW